MTKASVSILLFVSFWASASFAHSSDFQTLQVFRDISGQMSREQVSRSSDWQSLAADRVQNLGYSDATLWLRWRSENNTGQTRSQVVTLNYELLGPAQLFSRSAEPEKLKLHAWHSCPKIRGLRKQSFATEQSPGTTEYLLKIRSNSAFIIDIDMLSARESQNNQEKENSLLGYLFVFVFALGFYNLLLSVIHRRGIYLIYLFLNSFFALFLLVHAGVLRVIWPDQRFDLMRLVSTLALFIIVFLTVFTRSFLHTQKLQNRLDKLLILALIISLVQISVIALWYDSWFATAISLWLLAVAVLLMVVGFDSWRLGFKPARLFSLSWIFLFIAVAMSLLKAMNVLAVNTYNSWSFQIGFALEALVLSLAMEERVVRDNRHLDKLNADLEDKVQARTKALNIAAEKMRAHSEELEQESADRKNLQEQLLHSQKMESIGRLAGGIAHDMNNVLGAILGFAALLRKEKDDGTSEAEDLDDILTAARRGRDLTGKLLGFARKGVFRKEAVDMHQLLRENVDFLRHSLEKNITINLHFADSLPPCLGDPDQINLAIVNLCSNAAEAMPQGGQIDIYTDVIERDDENSDDSDIGSLIRVRVKDHGKGLSKEEQARAFEPFYSSKRGKGSGLGLAMVYGVAESHGGYAQLDCEPDQGCVASFVIKAAPELLDESGADSLVSSTLANNLPDPQGLYVLLADDERAMRSVGQRMLESLGCQVVLAQDGEEALKIFRREPQRYDLLVLDVRMPKLDGVEAYLQMRATRADICSLVTSGFSQDARLNEMVQDPCCGFLAKPFDLDGLQKALAKLPLRKKTSDSAVSLETS